MPARTRPGRALGLTIAGIVALALIGVLVVAILVNRDRGGRTELAPDDAAPPDIKDVPQTNLGASQVGIHTTGKFRYEIADKEDPSRLAGVMLAETARRLESGNHLLEKPQIWYYLADGRIVRFRADRGHAYLPTEDRGSRPETGEFEGDCAVELYEKPVGRPVDPAIDRPILTSKTTRMLYDGTLSQVTMPDVVKVESNELEFVGRDVLVQFNEATKPIQAWMHVEKLVSPIKYWAKGKDGTGGKLGARKDATSASATQPSTSGGSAPTVPAPASSPAKNSEAAVASAPAPPSSVSEPAISPAPAETFYQLTATRDVVVTLGTREIRADRLDGWAHLIDNKLRDGAVASPPEIEDRGEARASEHEAVDSQNLAAQEPVALNTRAADSKAPQQTPSGAALPIDSAGPTSPGNESSNRPSGGRKAVEPLTIMCSGPLDVRPIPAAPAELSANEVALRFVAMGNADVAFHDTETKAAAHATSIEYGATNMSLGLGGRDDEPVRLLLSGQGLATAPRFEVNLQSGRTRAHGAGELASAAGKDRDRRVSWTDGAEFDFAMLDGRLTSRLRNARLNGGFVARDSASELGGLAAVATFADDPRDASRQVLATLKIDGEAHASDGRGASMHADHLEASFKPGPRPGDSDPARILASGHVRGSKGESSLRADEIEAESARDKDGVLALTRAHARGSVRFDGVNGLWAEAPDVEADAASQTIDLLGVGAKVGQRGATLAGDQIRLEGGDAQRATVFGAGALEHEQVGRDGVESRVATTWTRQMTFDDHEGLAEFAGGVKSSWRRGALAHDTLNAERAKVWFTPAPKNATRREPDGLMSDGSRLTDRGSAVSNTATGTQRAAPGGAALEDRRVLKAEASGAGAEGSGEGLATLQSLRFASAPEAGAPAEFERVLFLEGDTIRLNNADAGVSGSEADALAGEIEVPGPGKLFAYDARAAASARDAQGEPMKLATGAKGQAVFAWKGSLTSDRDARRATMGGGVTMLHHRSSDGLITELECETLKAAIGDASRDSSELRSVEASGKAWMRSSQREILASTLLYDAASGLVDASADEGSIVSFAERRGASTLTARSMKWNLTTGRVEVVKPGTVVAPRE